MKEVIFCEGTLTYKDIIHHFQQLPGQVSARLHGHNSLSIVGSDSKTSSGESISGYGHFNLASAYHKRMKRIIDVAFSLFILITFPIQILITKLSIVKTSLLVLFKKRTFVGYSGADSRLPVLLPGILSPTGTRLNKQTVLDAGSLSRIDTWYAKEYTCLHDIRLIIKHWQQLA